MCDLKLNFFVYASHPKSLHVQTDTTKRFIRLILCVNDDDDDDDDDDNDDDDWCCGSFSGGIDQFQLGIFPGLDS